MSDNLGERVARIEEKTGNLGAIETKIDTINSSLRSIEKTLEGVSTDNAWLKKMFWTIFGISATAAIGAWIQILIYVLKK